MSESTSISLVLAFVWLVIGYVSIRWSVVLLRPRTGSLLSQTSDLLKHGQYVRAAGKLVEGNCSFTLPIR